MPEDENIVLQKAAQMGVSDQIMQVKSIKDTEDNRIYLAFSPALKKSKKYAALYTKGIRDLNKSGKLKKILASAHPETQ